MADDLNFVPKRFPIFQFRITTLLGWTTWASFIFLGFHVPTRLIADLITDAAFICALIAVLTAFFRTGATRANAIGFAVVYMATFYFGPLNSANSYGFQDSPPLLSLFHLAHPDNEIPMRIGGSWIQPPAYKAEDFVRICYCAISTLLGSLLAQYLYATQPREKPNPNNC